MTTRPFDFPHDLSPFPKQSQDLLRMAHALGWQMRWQGSNKNIVTLMSPVEPSKTINVPRTNLSDARHKSTVRGLARYSDPEKVQDFIEDSTTVKGASLRVALDLGPPAPVAKPTTAVAAAMEEARAKADAPQSTTEASQAEHAEAVSRTRYSDDEPERTLVSETPWMVRKDGIAGASGRMYESPAVLHRVWSDGTEDYRCRHCQYDNTNPRSVAVHAGKTKGHPATPEPEFRRVQDYEQSEIKRPMSAIRRLTSDLLHALDGLDDWSSMSPDELAKVLAEHVYDERPDREPAKPLTPEQVIARITLLVDGGRLADLHQQVDRLAAALVESTEAKNRLAGEVIAEQQKVEALREERRVLASMLSDAS